MSYTSRKLHFFLRLYQGSTLEMLPVLEIHMQMNNIHLLQIWSTKPIFDVPIYEHYAQHTKHEASIFSD